MRLASPILFTATITFAVVATSAALADPAASPARVTSVGPDRSGTPWYTPGYARFQIAVSFAGGAKCSFRTIAVNRETGLTYSQIDTVTTDGTPSYSFPFYAKPFLDTKDAPPGAYSFTVSGVATYDETGKVMVAPACDGSATGLVVLDDRAIGHPLPTLGTPAWVGENANGFAMASIDKSVHLRVPPVVAKCSATLSITHVDLNRHASAPVDVLREGTLIDARFVLARAGWKFETGTYDFALRASPDSNGGAKMPCMGSVAARLEVTPESVGLIRPQLAYKNVHHDGDMADIASDNTEIYPAIVGPKCSYQITLTPRAGSLGKDGPYTSSILVFDPRSKSNFLDLNNFVDRVYATYTVRVVPGIDAPTQKSGIPACRGGAEAVVKFDAPNGKLVTPRASQ